MAIFPKIECDSAIQVNDKFRIDASKTYISKGESAITLIEIEPEAGAGFINVTAASPKNWFLDWEYLTSGVKTLSLRVTTNGLPVTVTKDVECLSSVNDRLFSDDSDLVAIEHNILKYVPEGRSSFKYIHREAQSQILEWLWINGFRATDNSRITKDQVIDLAEVKFWAKYLALRLIFSDLSNAIDDVFDKKSKQYEVQEHRWRENAGLKLDFNKDGVQGAYEQSNITSRNLVRT